MYLFCTDLKTNSDHLRIQHQLFGFFNRDVVCLLRGTGWIFIYEGESNEHLKNWHTSILHYLRFSFDSLSYNSGGNLGFKVSNCLINIRIFVLREWSRERRIPCCFLSWPQRLASSYWLLAGYLSVRDCIMTPLHVRLLTVTHARYHRSLDH